MVSYDGALVEAVLLRRYKRFLADVRLPDGTEVVAHCANPGSMKGCWEPGARCRVLDVASPKRKLKWSLEQIEMNHTWVLTHTGRPNAVVGEALRAGLVPELAGYEHVRSEVKWGDSRLDFVLLDGSTQAPWESGDAPASRACLVEVKNVTLREDDGLGYFPDSVSKRGSKHLRELQAAVEAGHRAVLFFHVGRADLPSVAPAAHIDPVYAAAFREAVAAGVEVIARRCVLTVQGLELGEPVPLA